MKNRVTVIVPDRAICVDGEWVFLDFTAPKNVRVIQWQKDGASHIEHTDGSENAAITDYDKQVDPFVKLFEKEKKRLADLQAVSPSPEEILVQRRDEIADALAKLDSDSIRAIRAIQAGSGIAEDKQHLKKIDDRAAELRAELAKI